jgi:hypothetical protein
MLRILHGREQTERSDGVLGKMSAVSTGNNNGRYSRAAQCHRLKRWLEWLEKEAIQDLEISMPTAGTWKNGSPLSQLGYQSLTQFD